MLRSKITGLLLAAGLCAVVSGADVQAQGGPGLFDDLATGQGWAIPTPASSEEFVAARDGKIVISKDTSPVMSALGTSKSFDMSFPPNTWMHALLRLPDAHVGGDMYTTFSLNGQQVAQVNINGETHYTNKNGRCAVADRDQRYTIGLASDNRPNLPNRFNTATWTNDVSVGYPADVVRPYAAWTLFSVKYDVDSTGAPRWRFYVDGSEIEYRDIGNVAPAGKFQTAATVLPRTGVNVLTIRLEMLGDGNAYRPGTDYSTANQLQCFSVSAPFLVDAAGGPIPMPATVEWDALMVGGRQANPFDPKKVKQLVVGGRVGTSTAVLTDMIDWRDMLAQCPFMSYSEIRRVRLGAADASDFCLTRVKEDIFAGRVSTSEAVLSGAISWQNAQVSCPYMSETEKATVRVAVNAPQFCR